MKAEDYYQQGNAWRKQGDFHFLKPGRAEH